MAVIPTPRACTVTFLWLLISCLQQSGHTAEGRIEHSSPATAADSEATPPRPVTTAEEGVSQAADAPPSTHRGGGEGVSPGERVEVTSAGPSPGRPYQGSVVVDSRSVRQCLRHGQKREYHALSLEIVLQGNWTASVEEGEPQWIPTDTNTRLQCHLDLTVPPHLVVKVQLFNFSSTCDHIRRLHVVDSAGLDSLLDVCQSTSIAGEFSLSPHLSVHITTITPWMGDVTPANLLSLHLQLTAVAPAQKLELVRVGDSKGYVQTPRWDGQVHYPRSMNSKVVIDVPAQHVVMFSFFSVHLGSFRDCKEDLLRVYRRVPQGRFTVPKQVTLVCGDSILPPPQVLTTQTLMFWFCSNNRVQHPGFRALFSLHGTSRSPQQTADGLWNCTVAEWPDFRQHFPCNLESNCALSEDEAECGYVSAGCGAGAISVGQGCYQLHNLGQAKLSYDAMQHRCQARGGALASLNTRHEWRRVWRVLRQGRWERILVGLQPVPPTWPPMYRELLYWADGSVAYYTAVFNIPQGDWCAHFIGHWRTSSDLGGGPCQYTMLDKHILCELNASLPQPSARAIQLMPPTTQPRQGRLTRCPSGHLTHDFLACDLHSHCWADSASCQAPVTSLSPMFACSDGRVTVPYTLVCDHRQDCDDDSDEGFCVFPPCPVPEDFRCSNGQCVSADTVCDGQLHCLDQSHQGWCFREHQSARESKAHPGLVDMDRSGRLQVTTASPARGADGALTCPETHVQCALDNYYCLPVYLRCNGVYDCPGHEDEAECSNSTCPGFYRCRASQVCLHALHVCDGLYQCPQHDDELTCRLRCPPNCTCQGLAFTCTAPLDARRHPHLRYLDARGTWMTFAQVHNNTMLIYLSLARCNLTRVPRLTFPNLQLLDLSENLIGVLHSGHITDCPHLKTLSLSGNPLSLVFPAPSPQPSSSLHSLDLSDTALFSLDTANLSVFSQLRLLNLSGSGVEEVSEGGLRPFPRLEVVDMRGCGVRQFSPGLMDPLQQLQAVWADNYKLCCPAVLPAGFPLAHCHAPSNEISSCDTLLRSDFFRLFLYVFAFLALTGNAGSFVFRTFVSKRDRNQGFGVFVAQLCVSDFLMGLYLTAIGVADRLYQGSYLWEDVAWRHSAVCKMAGFLSLVSSEVSTFLIWLITVDRFLVLRFPFSRVRFRKRSAQAACLACWLTGLLLALAPLLPAASRWRFYQQSSICLPLPVTRQPFPGRPYSLGVMVILNSVLFLLIAAGQAVIYHAIGQNSLSLADSSKSGSQDLTIARRLITVAMSDFLCWFPIGVLGLLASQDVPVPGEVRVGLAIFVLPLNSALNPFLYTLNVIREKRRQAYFQRLQALFHSQHRARAAHPKGGNTHQ